MPLCAALHSLSSSSERFGGGLGAGLGILTSEDRDKWAAARQELTSISAANASNLDIIDRALFVLCLDEVRHRNTLSPVWSFPGGFFSNLFLCRRALVTWMKLGASVWQATAKTGGTTRLCSTSSSKTDEEGSTESTRTDNQRAAIDLFLLIFPTIREPRLINFPSIFQPHRCTDRGCDDRPHAAIRAQVLRSTATRGAVCIVQPWRSEKATVEPLAQPPICSVPVRPLCMLCFLSVLLWLDPVGDEQGHRELQQAEGKP